jgi:cytoskeletal protein RodZ
MSRRLTRIGLFCIAIIVAMILVWALVLVPLSSHSSAPTINVSWNDLNQSRARWDAQHIDQYEETVEYSRKNAFYSADTNGTWTLRVLSSTVQLISEHHTGAALDDKELASLTVGGFV